MKSDELLDLLWTARHSEFGVSCVSNDLERLRQRLYALRREHIQDFAALSFLIAKGRLVILNKESDNAEVPK